MTNAEKLKESFSFDITNVADAYIMTKTRDEVPEYKRVILTDWLSQEYKGGKKAEFTTVAKERDRMCEHHQFCIYCPLGELGGGSLCSESILRRPEIAEKIIMEWAAAHPATKKK